MSETRIRAPELPADLEWFNTDAPLKLADQRGKVVLLDFWSYCCINCMHVLPDLAYLEKKYPEDLTVIGVHSPKFPNERVGDNVQKAINRNFIRHPVAHDPKLGVWKQYGIKAWPSMIFIDPEGYVVGVLRGEGHRKQLDELITKHLAEADRKGIRKSSPLPISFKPETTDILSFPGKVHATGERLYISNTGRNKIIEAMPNGRILNQFGSGTPGWLDGSTDAAAFREPQGLTLVERYLFVADTGNHCIRRIDLRGREVATIAGTGAQAREPVSTFDRPTDVPLNSPWDLAQYGGRIFIAMAGSHQVWAYQLGSNSLEVVAGSGREGIDDGLGRMAEFAQPSGLAVGGDIEALVYVADSETSAIRQIRPRTAEVDTVVGMGLFEFGDRDGTGLDVRLQHPLGICYDDRRKLYWIADTYNHKIKTLDPDTREVRTFAVSAPLHEPGGISFDGEYLWIANTNRHEILKVDPDTGDAEVIDFFEVQF